MPTNPVPFGVFGYATAALTYGLHLLTGFPKAETPEDARRIRASLIANGFAFGGIAQFTAAILLFVLYNDIVTATTLAIFGVLWTAIWLNDYFNLDPRALLFLDIAIAIYTLFGGTWTIMLGHPVLTALFWSITALVIALAVLHGKGRGGKAVGVLALENALLAYYVCFALVYSELGISLPL